MKKILIFTLLGFSLHGVQGQINLSHPAVIDKTNSNVFLDASVNFSAAAGAANNVGKGLVIPSVDLINFQFNADFISSTEAPSFYDGMLVYNSASGTTLTTGNRSSTATTVSPGFYYFSNPNGSTNENITGGIWKPLSAAGTQGPAGPQGPIGLTGANGAEGAEGPSAYKVWLTNGNTGTEAQFLASLIGPAGAQGPIGLTGASGPQGATGPTGPTGLTGPAGQNGLSNYQIAVNNGFLGTEIQWLESLQGEPGSNATITGTSPIEVTNGVVSIADAGIGASKLSDMGASSGQALAWNGTTWEPSTIESASKDITGTEIALTTKIDGVQLYAIKGTFTASGTSALVTIAKPTGMTGYYSLTTYKDGKTFRRDISSFDMAATSDNVITGTGAYSEVYPAGTYNYVLEYFK